MAEALEAVTAEALSRRESSAVSWFALVLFSVGMWAFIPPLREQG